MSLDLLLYHVTLLGIAMLLVQSLAVIFRLNLFSLGQQGYFGLGAYVAVIFLKASLPAGLAWHLDSWGARAGGLALFITSVALAALVTAGAGALTLHWLGHLRGDYFAVATLILAETIQGVTANCSYVGGGLGIEIPYLFLDNSARERLLLAGFYAALLVAANIVLFRRLERLGGSLHGLYVHALRDDELAAELSGIDGRRLRRALWIPMTAVAGAAGAIFANFSSLLTPSDLSFVNSLPVLLAVILGGQVLRHCLYAMAGVYTIYEILKLHLFGFFGDVFGQWFSDWKEILFALALLMAAIGRALWARRSQGAAEGGAEPHLPAGGLA